MRLTTLQTSTASWCTQGTCTQRTSGSTRLLIYSCNMVSIIPHRFTPAMRFGQVVLDEGRCAAPVRVPPIVALEAGVLVEVVAPVEAPVRDAAVLEVDELQAVRRHVAVRAVLRMPERIVTTHTQLPWLESPKTASQRPVVAFADACNKCYEAQDDTALRISPESLYRTLTA